MSGPALGDFPVLVDFATGPNGAPAPSAPVKASAWQVATDDDPASAGPFLRWAGDARPEGTVGLASADFIPQRYVLGATIPGTAERQTLRLIVPARLKTGAAPVGGCGPHSLAIIIEQLRDGEVVDSTVATTAGLPVVHPHDGLRWDDKYPLEVLQAGIDHARIVLQAQGGSTATVDFGQIRYHVSPYVDLGASLPHSGGVRVSADTGVVVRPSAVVAQLRRAKLPHSREAFVDGQGKASPAVYTYLQAVDSALGEVAALADEARAVATALPRKLGSPTGAVSQIPAVKPTALVAPRSVQARPSGNTYTVELVNDTLVPASLSFYGTGIAGEKGWQALSTGFSAGPGVKLTTDPDTGVTEIASADGGAVPTRIPDGGTYTVATDTQALFALPIELEGTAALVIDGALVEVN